MDQQRTPPKRRLDTSALHRTLGIRRSRRLAVCVAAAATFALTGSTSQAGATPSGRTASNAGHGTTVAPCNPQIVTLAPLVPGESAGVTTMNDAGLVAGFSRDQAEHRSAVVWRDADTPHDLGYVGEDVDPANVETYPTAVNDHKQVLVGETVGNYRGHRARTYAFIWQDGSTTTLPSPPRRSAVQPLDLNNHGIAVGAAGGRHATTRAIYWKNSNAHLLPVPKGSLWSEARSINNHGLAVGSVQVTEDIYRGWWWKLNGKNGPLRAKDSWPEPHSTGIAVDDRSRILGFRTLTYMWRGPYAKPHHVLGRTHSLTAIDQSADVVGNAGGFRGLGDHAWVARLTDRRTTQLPDPPAPPEDGWANTFATTVGRGVTPYAPQGGVTVGGWTDPYGLDVGLAVLWTCAQTYRAAP